MRIDRNLNVVIPLQRADGTEIFVHHASIGSDVFRQYWHLAGQTMNALYSRGFGMFAPRYAAEMVREIAADNGGTDEAARRRALEKVEKGLLPTLRRQTHVLAPGASGWEMLPFEDARRDGVIDEEESDQVESAVVFFTLALRSHLKAQQDQVTAALSLWSAQVTSLGCTEFLSSLTTSTEGATTGAIAAA